MRMKFNDIQVGKKFKTSANITYQKISTKNAKPIIDSAKKPINNGRETTAFYNNKLMLEIV